MDLIRDFQEYCISLGGKPKVEAVRPERIVKGDLWCRDARRAPDPKRLIELMRKASDVLRSSAGDIVTMRFDLEEGMGGSRAYIGAVVREEGPTVVHFFKEKQVLPAWERDLGSSVKKLGSMLEELKAGKRWNYLLMDTYSSFQCYLSPKSEGADPEDLRGILEEARKILEWNVKAERKTGRTFMVD